VKALEVKRKGRTTMGSSMTQGALWSAASEDWLDNEPFSIPLYEAAFGQLQLGEGTRLLDLGCGAGLAMLMAAERGAAVTGIDAAPALLEVARRRLPGSEVAEGDLEALPFADAAFDAVTSFNAVQFAADPVAALREARRVTAPGGHVVVTTWGDPQECETRTVLAAVGALLPPARPNAQGPFALSAPGQLEALVTEAGLAPLRTVDVRAPFVFADLESGIRIQSSAGPIQRAIQHAGWDRTRRALAEAFAPAQRADGTYRFDNTFRVLVATP
jgi:SAM-dependent methyltransferase